jgi:hypothetical protein
LLISDHGQYITTKEAAKLRESDPEATWQNVSETWKNQTIEEINTWLKNENIPPVKEHVFKWVMGKKLRNRKSAGTYSDSSSPERLILTVSQLRSLRERVRRQVPPFRRPRNLGKLSKLTGLLTLYEMFNGKLPLQSRTTCSRMCENVRSQLGGQAVSAWTMQTLSPIQLSLPQTQRAFSVTHLHHTAPTSKGRFTLSNTAEIMPHPAAAS